MRRLRRTAVDALLLATLGIVACPLSPAVASLSATTSNAGTFRNLEVVPVTLDPASVSGGTARLAWSASATAATEPVVYVIMRRPAGGAYAVLASTGGLTYDDPAGVGTWEYVIRTTVAPFSSDSNMERARIRAKK